MHSSVRRKRDKDGEEWEIEFDSPEEAVKLPSIIREIKKSEKKSLTEKVKEALVTEPIKAIFAIITGVIVAFLV
jgi:acid phosphatase family membrane protein YuiD